MPVRLSAVVVLLLLTGGAVGAASPAYADPGFGTAPVVAPPSAPETQVAITSVDVGRHAGFDRVVFRLSGPTLGYEAKYVDSLIEDPTGRPLSLAGSAVLTIAMRQTDWIDSPSPRINRSPGFPALRQVRFAGEFEAVVSYGIGQATKAGFRVFRLTGPDRIVVDVAHPAGAVTRAPAAPSATGTATPGTGSGAGSGSGSTLPETGPRTSPATVVFLGGLLVLAGLVAASLGLRLRRGSGT